MRINIRYSGSGWEGGRVYPWMGGFGVLQRLGPVGFYIDVLIGVFGQVYPWMGGFGVLQRLGSVGFYIDVAQTSPYPLLHVEE